MNLTEEISAAWERKSLNGSHERMEFTNKGLALGAGTLLSKMRADQSGQDKLHLADERCVLAMLSTAYEQPVDPHALTKIRRAVELWNGGEKALGAIHLAFVRLPPCTPRASLRLFAAERLMESGLAPEALMKCQDFDTAPLSFLKYSPDQPRDDHGRWTSDAGAGSETGLQEGRSVSNGGGGNEKDPKYEEERRQGTESRKEDIEHGRPVNVLPPGLVGSGERGGLPYVPRATASSGPKPSDFVGQDFGKLGIGVEKPNLRMGEVSWHASDARMNRKVTTDDIQSTVEDPILVLQQSDGRFYYLSDKAAVVLDPKGRVVTTYPSSHFDTIIKGILDQAYRGKRK